MLVSGRRPILPLQGERITGIEPMSPEWKPGDLPLIDIRGPRTGLPLMIDEASLGRRRPILSPRRSGGKNRPSTRESNPSGPFEGALLPFVDEAEGEEKKEVHHGPKTKEANEI